MKRRYANLSLLTKIMLSTSVAITVLFAIAGQIVLRNILIPVVTVVGIEFGSLVAFSTITETVFAWPGMGKLLIDSIYQLDRPVVVAYVMLATLLFVSVNFLVDVLYAALDPRVKLAGDSA